METSAQYVPHVGDVIRVVRSSRDPSIGQYYFVGDVGKVLSIDEDNDLFVRFEGGYGNKRIVGAGKWYVGVENARLVHRPVTATQPPVLSELLGERDVLRDELAAVVEQRDRLLAAAKSLVRDVELTYEAGSLAGYPSDTNEMDAMRAAIAAVESPSTRANTIEELRRVAEDRGYSPAWAERVMEARCNLPVVVAVESDSKFLGEPRTDVPSALQLIGHMHEPNADGWIEWNGGECPVGDDVAIEVLLRNGLSCWVGVRPPSEWAWEKFDGDHCIVAYRVLPSEASK